MKKLSILFVIACGFLPFLQAADRCDQRLSPEEFRAKQQTYITEKASLTKAEATAFFPVYFELQDKKKKLSDEAWKQMHSGKNEDTTDEQYNKILEKVYNNRIASDELDKSYYQQFKKILSPKKIYLIQRAEVHFHRELLRDVRKKHPGAPARK